MERNQAGQVLNPPQNPHGFREHASGLIVPDELSREREVWTKSEWQLLERTTKLLEARGIKPYFRCLNEKCQAAPMSRERLPDGSIALRCVHKDRRFTKAF